MELSGQQVNQIKTALLSAYTVEELRQLVPH